MRKLIALCINFQFINIFLQAAPPNEIPAELYAEFTMNGQMGVASFYCNDSYPPEHPIIYDYQQIETLKQKALQKKEGYYWSTDSYLYSAFDRYRSFIAGKKIGILGSTIPWYEAIVLTYGGFPITIEYNKIISEHPDIRTMTVNEYEQNPEKFDAILSISSFEHDGLGRYGDPINPNGDLLAMEKAKLMLKAGGLLFLAVPVGPDTIVWNAHRIYGNKRLNLLLAGWNVVETIGFNESDFYANDSYHSYHGSQQPLFVLRAKEN